MKYILLIYQTEEGWGDSSEAARGLIAAEYTQFTQRIKLHGNYLASAQLHTTGSATSVRIRNSERLLTDGPFADTHEQLGGYYLIEAKHLDEALDIAAQIPSARFGTVEVRPIVEPSPCGLARQRSEMF